MSLCPGPISAAELRRLGLEQGFHRIALLPSHRLPETLAGEQQIAALEEGTFLLAALSCYRAEEEDLSAPGDPHALISPFARRHYYREAVVRMKRVARAVCENLGLPRREVRIFCNSRLAEKHLAAASGLGMYGKNSLILVPGLGSTFVIAGMFLPFSFPEAGEGEEMKRPIVADCLSTISDPADRSFPLCGSCRACLEACPVGALPGPGRLDESRCLQALCTLTEPFSESNRTAWGYRFYGCRSCQDVCPYNRDLKMQTETGLGALGASISLKRLLSLSPGELKDFLKGSALGMSWIPARALLRNALIAAGNRKDPALREVLSRWLRSRDVLLRSAARWAVDRIEASGERSGPATSR